MSKPEIQRCPTCDAKLSGRWERLGAGLCNTLVKFYRAAVGRRTAVLHLHEDLSLNKFEYTNFCKLRYFGLVENGERAGTYRITPSGERFVRGENKAATRVLVFRNEVKRHDGEYATIAQILGTRPYWDRRDDYLTRTERPDNPDQESLF
jgi:hypothetical protein